MKKKIAYQGEPGANSHIACNEARPEMEPLPCRTFERVFETVETGEADLAMIPIENTVAGRVGDIHYLLPRTTLQIIGEHYLPIRHQLMGLKGSKLEDIKSARSHIMGLGQCRDFLRARQIESVTAADTAGAAREVSEAGDPTLAAIAPRLAAQVYDLDILAENIEDAEHNTTRFVIMSREASDIEAGEGQVKTAFLFQVRNIPAALFKVMGGFATNGINMTKLESYYDTDSFTATEFFADIEGHEGMANVSRAIEELRFHSKRVRILGTYEQERKRGGS